MKSVVTIGFTVVVILCVFLVVAAVIQFIQEKNVKKEILAAKPVPMKIAKGRWIVIGSGISAATVVYYMDPPLRSATYLREGTTRFGGRILSQPRSLDPMNTITQAQEFGAWEYDTFNHVYTKAFLLSLQMPTYLQIFYPNRSFMYFGGKRLPWPPVPTLPVDVPYGDVPVGDVQKWTAHTSIPPSLAPTASTKTLWNLVKPITSSVVTGLGWQAVPFRAILNTQVQYDRQVKSILSVSPTTVTVSYTSGETESVQGVVLTCPPGDLVNIAGILPEAKALVQNSLVPVTQGILNLQWKAADAWWPQLGFEHAVAATDTPLGRFATVDAGDMRCEISGEDMVAYWTNMLVKEGMAAAAAQVATILTEIFGKPVPAPAFVSFRGWPNGLWLWKSGVDKAAARLKMVRPCGEDVAVWWSSGDISNNQGWVEGCVEAGLSTAKAVNSYVQM